MQIRDYIPGSADDDYATYYLRPNRYWHGFTVGAALGGLAVAAGYMIANSASNSRDSRIIRLEDSVQIGRRVEDVFAAWSDLGRLPLWLKMVNNVRVNGRHSFWDVTVDGRAYRWHAEAIQWVPNEAIGWKSVSGPKHTGRITFSPLGDDTVVHVTMNYAPPLGLGRLLSPVGENLEAHINKALRDFKNALEGDQANVTGTRQSGASEAASTAQSSRSGQVDRNRPPARAAWKEDLPGESRRTGTDNNANIDPSNPVRYSRPPSAGYPTPTKEEIKRK
jgi:uncharacterized membrane protein